MRLPIGENLVRAGVAGGWIVGGRLLGLAWTAGLILTLGVADYGRYAMAFALAAILAAPLDNIFLVRSLRIDDERFLGERSTRVLVGTGLLLLGAAVYGASFEIGFGLVVAGGEIVFNAYKSGALREGQPDVVQRLDLIRQAAAIALGSLYVFLTPDPQLGIAGLCYLAPYVLVVALAAVRALRYRPLVPGGGREIGLLWLDALALAAYIQGDVLLLGLVAGNEVAGLYSVVSVLALAAASLAQMYVHTFHERLRMQNGDPSAGPSAKAIVVVATSLGVSVLAAAGLLALFPVDEQLPPALAIMSLFVVGRSVSLVLQTILYVQRRDLPRVVGGGAVAALKLLLIVLLAPLGAIGGAIASVVAEVGLVIIYRKVAYARRSPQPSTETDAEPPLPTDGTL